MEVFISWSGERSRCVAEALRNWIPKIINAVVPWLSSADIDKGARWSADVASKLESSKVGIICLTPSNVHSDWILFEAGALSKTLKNTFVCPLLIGLEPSDIKGPLAQFQATRSTKDEVKKLIITINSALGEKALADGHLDEAFEVWWPRLEAHFQNLPSDEGPTKPPRPERELLEEILALVRSEARQKPQQSQAVEEERQVQREYSEMRIRQAFLHAAKLEELSIVSYEIRRTVDGFMVDFETTGGNRQIEFGAGTRPMTVLVKMIQNRLRMLPESDPPTDTQRP